MCAWGDTTGGNIATDGTTIFRIKNSYANFNLGPVNFWWVCSPGCSTAVFCLTMILPVRP